MSHSNDDKRSAAPAAAGKPTLEALLRLKRSERPDETFWEEFERGLHRKQLAAIVEPKPWWLGLAIWGRRLAPVGLPVSAAAAALFAVMVVRTQSPFSSTPPVLNDRSDRSGSEIARSDKAPANLASPPTAVLVARAASGLTEPRTSGAEAIAIPAEVSDTPPESVSTLIEASDSVVSAPVVVPAASESVAIPLVDSLLELGGASTPPTPSESTIAENLAAVRTENPEMILAAAASSGGGEAVADNLAIEPALKMEVRNPRHARVLLAMADNPSVETPGGLTSLRDRAARGLDHEDSLSGSASRLGVGGDRFSVSF
jgi:hypothetical protein